ncbi:flagellar basal-body rod protein FlgF [Roseococcus sp. SDR]|uniref:flagellar basal-body rod protein FlgF n=1 Tax=Roseococcus sp. SDR TaxID=2835532 RepID=UPI001BCD1D80|nr:flagellar basal-body rod protein FlgF [Roseococcus sp. SDR]MBS7789973.1 flagellar basal-body rod protein FlgF [Roseococcus sp. SDR]MBV1845287.1 flagellar basal-body rod protein FlgF [Roseococcus sp. SDR]
MDSPGYIVLSRLTAQQRASQFTAHNLANADTPGYRAARPIFAEHVERQGRVHGPNGAAQVGYTWDRASWRETQPGAISATGNPLDIAISGQGFFVVETPRGERYTRAGRFAIGADGQIVDVTGAPVLNTDSRPIAVSPGDTRIEVQGDGTIRSENGVIGRLRIVRFANEQQLRAEGDRHLDAAGQAPEEIARPQLVQGALEGSNVQSVLEMTRMMAELREFQFATQFLEREGERQQSAVDRLLRRRS